MDGLYREMSEALTNRGNRPYAAVGSISTEDISLAQVQALIWAEKMDWGKAKKCKII